MQAIKVKYIDTTKYKVVISDDTWCDNNPTNWGNYTIVQFKDRDFNSYASIDDYCTENGKLLPSIQAKIKAGKIFTFDYSRYSNCDGGYYRYPSNETDIDNIDGFIIFEDGYIKGTSYEERKKYATQDLEEYTQYCNGEVYNVSIETVSGIEVDECNCFIGDYAVMQFIADTLPDAINDNVSIVGAYDDGTTYDVWFDYDKCKKA